MSTYTRIYYHVVFATKGRIACLSRDERASLFEYFAGTLRNKDCYVHAIGGVADHVHIFFSLHPSHGLADIVKDLKLSASKWIREGRRFQGFAGWQDGYSAFTVSHDKVDRVKRYINRQEEHHAHESFLEELQEMLKETGLEYDERYPP